MEKQAQPEMEMETEMEKETERRINHYHIYVICSRRSEEAGARTNGRELLVAAKIFAQAIKTAINQRGLWP